MPQLPHSCHIKLSYQIKTGYLSMTLNMDNLDSIIIIIMNFYSPVSNSRCHSIGHKMRIARIKIRVDSPGRWERA